MIFLFGTADVLEEEYDCLLGKLAEDYEVDFNGLQEPIKKK